MKNTFLHQKKSGKIKLRNADALSFPSNLVRKCSGDSGDGEVIPIKTISSNAYPGPRGLFTGIKVFWIEVKVIIKGSQHCFLL